MVINPKKLNNQSDNQPTPTDKDQVKKLVEENLKLTQEIHTMLKSVKSFVVWQRIFNIVKILIIIVPLVLGIIYIPRIIEEIQTNPDKYIGKSWLTTYFENLFKSAATEVNLDNVDVDKLPPEAQKYIK